MTLLEARNLGVGYKVPGASLLSGPRLLPTVSDFFTQEAAG